MFDRKNPVGIIEVLSSFDERRALGVILGDCPFHTLSKNNLVLHG